MRLALPLGAAVAAVVLTIAVAMQDDGVPDCADARAAEVTASSAHQDALKLLDAAWVSARRDGAPQDDVALHHAEQTKADLHAARAVAASLCRADP